MNGIYRTSFAKGHEYRHTELIDPDGRVLADIRIDTLRGPEEADRAYAVLVRAMTALEEYEQPLIKAIEHDRARGMAA